MIPLLPDRQAPLPSPLCLRFAELKFEPSARKCQHLPGADGQHFQHQKENWAHTYFLLVQRGDRTAPLEFNMFSVPIKWLIESYSSNQLLTQGNSIAGTSANGL